MTYDTNYKKRLILGILLVNMMVVAALLVFSTQAQSNLVQNSGFEASPDFVSWNDWGNTAISNDARTGNNAAQANTPGGGRGQAVNVISGTTYVLTVWGKVGAAGEFGWVGIQNSDESWKQQIEFTETDYTYKEITVTVPAANDTYTVYIWGGGIAGSYFLADDITLIDVSSNLVQNPRFEASPDFNDWADWGNTAISNDAHTGNNAGQANTPGGGRGQAVNVISDTTYVLGGWGKVGTTGEFGWIGIQNSDESWKHQMEFTETSYTYKEITVTIPTAIDTYSVYFWGGGIAGSYFLADDISLVENVGPPPPPSISGTFYVDCTAVTDGDGSQASPWNNLATVNSYAYTAGSSILFNRGTTCTGQLAPQGSGGDGSANTIGAYGVGPLPIIDGDVNEAALRLFNQEYWELENLEIQGGTTFGILVDGDGSAVLNHIHLRDLVVHDVFGGTMSVKTTGLVVIGYNWTQQFDDVLIDGVTAYNTDLWAGIVVSGKGFKMQPTRSNDVTIRNSTVYNTYGDGIVVFSSNNVLIENNVAYDTGNEPTKTIGTPNAIWTWDCGNCVVQFNEAYENSSPEVDGGAFDIDYYSTNTTVQYNYGHDNDGYCAAIFATDGTTSNNTIRYNVCANNARDASQPSDRNAELYFVVWESGGKGYIEDTQVYNNTIYWNPANATDHYAIAAYDLWNGEGFNGSNVIMNNIVYGNNPNMVNMGLNTNVLLDYNLYWYTGEGDPVFKWGNDTYTGLSVFQSGAGQEANGLYADPKLNNPTYSEVGFPTTAFTLQSDSPAIDAGADLVDLGYVSDMGTQDFFANSLPVDGVYNMGAYEGDGESYTIYLPLVFNSQ